MKKALLLILVMAAAVQLKAQSTFKPPAFVPSFKQHKLKPDSVIAKLVMPSTTLSFNNKSLNTPEMISELPATTTYADDRMPVAKVYSEDKMPVAKTYSDDRMPVINIGKPATHILKPQLKNPDTFAMPDTAVKKTDPGKFNFKSPY